jgi:hypothetical protein
MSYFGNTLSIEVEENCRKLADIFRAGGYDADVFMPAATDALCSLVELHAYAGKIKSIKDYNTVCQLLGIPPKPDAPPRPEPKRKIIRAHYRGKK